MAVLEPVVPDEKTAKEFLTKRSNWGRWGDQAGKGTINLITPEKRVEAAHLVKTGRSVSLSRPLPLSPTPDNPRSVIHWTYTFKHGQGGEAVDFYGIDYHTPQSTHLDAPSHLWDEGGGWEGWDPKAMITDKGAAFGGVEEWQEGIITRGVLLDVPKHRGEAFVTFEKPVHGWELDDIAKEEGVTVGPGDAVIVYSGRDAYARDRGGYPIGPPRPGLHATCLPFLRDHDVAVMGWDMHDLMPNGYDDMLILPHAALYHYGLCLLDSCLLEPLSRACAEEGRYEFMLTICPLPVVGGTGCVVNPIAMF